MVDRGGAEVDNASEGWQSTMSPRKECYTVKHEYYEHA